MLVAHRTEAGRPEDEQPARARLEPEPARREHPKKVSAREEQGVPLDRPDPQYHAVGPSADLRGRLPFRAAVAEQLPVGTLRVNLGAGPAFVRAVVPLPEVGLDLRRGTEARQLARSDRPLQRAREDRGELHALEPLSQSDGFGFSLRGERQVGHARVLMRDGPGRLPVPRKVHNRKCVAHDWPVLLVIRMLSADRALRYRRRHTWSPASRDAALPDARNSRSGSAPWQNRLMTATVTPTKGKTTANCTTKKDASVCENVPTTPSNTVK